MNSISNNQFKQTQETSNKIKVLNSKPTQAIQVNSRKRGNSTNSNIRFIPKNNSIQQQTPSLHLNDPLISSIITQVPNKPSPQIQKMEKKSHSYSPSRMLNSMHLSLLPKKTTNKKTLVLDLDETLVHSGFNPFPYPSDVVIQLEFENLIHDIHVLVRPGVSEFLQLMAEKYEIVIFTASLSKYADPLLDIIDKNGYCSFRLFREHCTMINNAYVKDLKRLGRDLKDIIIVDNSPISYWLNPENGLPILSWFDDKNDKELYNIIPILDFLAEVPDVREHIKKIVIDNEIWYSKASAHIKSYKTLMNKKNKKKINNNNNSNNSSVNNKSIKKDKDNNNKEVDSINASSNNNNKKLQQINIKIINNNITNYICNGNNNNNNQSETNQNINNINTTTTASFKQIVSNPLRQSSSVSTSQNNINVNTNSNNNKLAFLPKNTKHINSFRNLAVNNPSIPMNELCSNNNKNNNTNGNNNHKLFHHKKGESFQGQTSYHKNAFLKSSTNYITTTSNNSKQINTVNLTSVDFLKSNRRKNPVKYTSINPLLNKTNLRPGTSSSVNIKQNTRDIDFKRKPSKHKITSSTNLGYKTTTNMGHIKSLSFNFDVNGLNTVRPKSSKKVQYNHNSNYYDIKKNTNSQEKDLRYDLTEILQKRGLSKSSRANDNKGGFKYSNVIINTGDINPNISNNKFSFKYTNKIMQ